jgi:hypothetical protein
MLLDWRNLNNRIDDDLTLRLCRLIDEVDPLAAQPGAYDVVLKDFYKYWPLTRSEGGLPPWPERDPAHLAIMAIASVYARLWAIAAEHRRSDGEEGGNDEEISALQEKLDTEENEWRASMNLPMVDSQP